MTVVTATITDITQANPPVVTATGHGNSTGDEVTITGVVGMTDLNGNTYTITLDENDPTNQFSLNGVKFEGYTEYASGGKCVNANSFELDGVNSGGYEAYTSSGGSLRVSDNLTCDDHSEEEQHDCGVNGRKCVCMTLE